MELPDLGVHCSQADCKKLDFLPLKCEICKNSFCHDHFLYHMCTHSVDNRVPVCPLCNNPIPIPRGISPDVVVNSHIDDQCELSKNRGVFKNKCFFKGCKTKEVVKIICSDCNNNYCLKHRHPLDHSCKETVKSFRERVLSTNFATRNMPNTTATQNGMKTESLPQELHSSSKKMTQEEIDFELAKQLHYSNQASGDNNNRRDRCRIS